MPPRLSIVIPAHNRPDLLRLCLTSVVRHAPADTEILVVDDGSRDRCVSQTAEAFPGVRILRRELAGGFCVAVNAGVAAAAGEIVELLNDDTEVTAGWAEAALGHFGDARIAAVTPLVLMGRPGEQPPSVDSAGDRYHIGGIAGKRGHGQPLRQQHLVGGLVFGANGAGAFFRREVFLRAGGMPEEFGAYFDDVDLSFRLHRAGFMVRYEPGSRVYHRVSASHGPPRGDLLAQQSRNEEMVFWRNLPVAELCWALPLHLAVLAGKAVRRLRQRQFLPFLRGRLAAWRAFPAILRHRRQLANLGRVSSTRDWGVERHLWPQESANAAVGGSDHGLALRLGDDGPHRRDARQVGCAS